MLEKIGIYIEDNGVIRTIFKDDKGYIDVTLEENNDMDYYYLSVPFSYDLDGKQIISIDTIINVLDDILKNINGGRLTIYVRNSHYNNSLSYFCNNLSNKISFKFLNYESIVVKFVNNDISHLYNRIINRVLHDRFNEEDKKLFDEWCMRHKIVNMQRQDYISWDEYFMAISKLSAMRSKDPSTQVGACIVSEDNRLLSIGYNGAPNGFSDIKFPWDREGKTLNTKYPFVVHAERNAILNYRGSRQDFIGARIYVDLFPCNECAKEIIQSGISEVIYLSDKYADTESVIASKMLLDECGVKYRQLEEEYRKVLTIDLRK